MKDMGFNSNFNEWQTGYIERIYLQGYSFYPDSEDIYRKCYREREIDPIDITKNKEPNESDASKSDIDFNHNVYAPGDELDVPGAELDDEQEHIGNEDEENNYYSLGGDDHNDLDEEISDS